MLKVDKQYSERHHGGTHCDWTAARFEMTACGSELSLAMHTKGER